MKHDLIFLIAIMIIVSATVDRIEDIISNDSFKEEMKMFKARGGRNTANMGENVCERLNILEKVHKLPVTDCKTIYHPENIKSLRNN